MEKELSNSVDDLINYIVNTEEYKSCIRYKEELNNDISIKDKVSKIKRLQKEFVKSNDSKIKREIDILDKELNNIDLFCKYNHNLEIINNMINYVKDELNDYFSKLFNENTD